MLLTIWHYLFYSFLSIFIFFFSGLGLTILLSPQNLRKYILFLSPTVGFCYSTLIGWYCYNLDLRGTDSYAPIILIPPVFFLALAILKYRKQTPESDKILNRKLVAPLLVGIIAFLVLSVPFFKHTDGLTTISIGNNDIADTGLQARFLKEFAYSDTTGYLGQITDPKEQTNYLKTGIGSARENRFGSPFSVALLSSLFSMEEYQFASLSIHIFFLLSVVHQTFQWVNSKV